MNHRLKELYPLFKFVDESVSKEQFLTAFDSVIKQVLRVEEVLVKKIDAKTELISQKLESLYNTYTQELEKIDDENTSNLSNFKKLAIQQINDVFIKSKINEKSKIIIEKLTDKVKEVDRKIEEMNVKMGEVHDGKDADEEKIVADVLTKIPESKKETPVELREKLESLKGEERLDKDAIRGLKEEIESLKQIIAKTPARRGGMRKVPIIRSIDLTGDVDGSTTTFTLPRDTVRVLGVWGTQFPISFRADIDWTFSGQTLSLVAAQVGTPQSGQTLFCLIETLFYA